MCSTWSSQTTLAKIEGLISTEAKLRIKTMIQAKKQCDASKKLDCNDVVFRLKNT